MRYYQSWNSLEQKAIVWLELCDLSANLMFEGIKLNLNDEVLAKKEFWRRLNNIRQKNRLITQQTMAKII
ncbi:MAG: hypothetical protein AB1414_14910 [bacterium]